MGSHFDCIGLRGLDEELIRSVLERGESREREVRFLGGTVRRESTVTWIDPSGAGLVIHLDEEGRGVDDTPFFASQSSVSVVPKAFASEVCNPLIVDVLEDGELCYPVAVQLADVEIAREIELGKPRKLAVALFAEDVRVHESRDAFIESQRKSGGPVFGAESFIPSGLFGSGPPTARALVAGRVLAAKRLENKLTGERFGWARLKTFGGTFEAVLPEAEIDAIGSDSVIHGGFWLVSHVAASE